MGAFLCSSRPQAGKFWDFEVQNHVEIVCFAIEIDALVSRNAKHFRLHRACHQNTSNLVDFRQSRTDQKMRYKNTPPLFVPDLKQGGGLFLSGIPLIRNLHLDSSFPFTM